MVIFFGKSLGLIWTQIKENGNSMKMKSVSLHILSGMNLVEAYKQCNVLGNGETVSKTKKNYLFPIVFQLSKTKLLYFFFALDTIKQIAGMKTSNCSSPVCLPF